MAGNPGGERPSERFIQLSGVIPKLALRADLGPPRSECGVGALMAWADRLWAISYVSSGAESGSGTGIFRHPTHAGDVDGDGKTDLIFPFEDWRHDSGLSVRVLLSKGDGSWTQKEEYIGWGPGVHQHATLAGDVDGDGKTDLMFPFQYWWEETPAA